NNSVGDVEDNQETGQPINQVTVDEQVVLDQDGIRITVKSLSIDDLWGPCLKVLVENSSNRSVTVQVRDLSINGAMVESIFSCDVAAGKKANDEIVFMSSDLEAAGIEIIKEIELKFHVFDSESWDTIFDSEPIRIVTSADASFDQSFEDSGFVALDQHGFKIVIKRLSSEDSLWGADVHVYIENNSNTDATIQIRDMSVNGFMVDPIFSVDVLAGKKAFDTITFLESDLLDNDIDSIEQLEFYFHVFDKDSWDTLFDSEIITVYFE
ncbi:MAG TPA: hypothetical protein PLZ49_08770, partial [Bacillota bacterium]|nr:hypothetical protein [Bacillota bacterium]